MPPPPYPTLISRYFCQTLYVIASVAIVSDRGTVAIGSSSPRWFVSRLCYLQGGPEPRDHTLIPGWSKGYLVGIVRRADHHVTLAGPLSHVCHRYQSKKTVLGYLLTYASKGRSSGYSDDNRRLAKPSGILEPSGMALLFLFANF